MYCSMYAVQKQHGLIVLSLMKVQLICGCKAQTQHLFIIFISNPEVVMVHN